jgi:protein phosphatase
MSCAHTRLQWISAGATDRGQVRRINEDAYLDRPDIGLWAVADGMGGHAAGDLASRLVIHALQTTLPNRLLGRSVMNLQHRLEEANRQLRAEARHRGVSVIGSTLAALVAASVHCVLLWVGDSRIYCLREGILQRLSHDHSQVQDLVDQGVIAQESAEIHSAANIITRALGAEDELQIDGLICEIKSGDRFLLCTDGLTKELSEGDIAKLLGQMAVRTLPQALVSQACRRGGRDNVTAVVIQFLAPEASGADC